MTDFFSHTHIAPAHCHFFVFFDKYVFLALVLLFYPSVSKKEAETAREIFLTCRSKCPNLVNKLFINAAQPHIQGKIPQYPDLYKTTNMSISVDLLTFIEHVHILTYIVITSEQEKKIYLSMA